MSNSIVSRETWLEERMALLRREKSVTRELDLLAIERQKLPWVKIEKSYDLELPGGKISLIDLFGPCHNRGIQQMNGAFGYVDLLPFGGN